MMQPIRALIVDDEEPGRINLRYALAEHAHWRVVAECASAASAREAEILATSLLLAGGLNSAAFEADAAGIPAVLVDREGHTRLAGGLR